MAEQIEAGDIVLHRPTGETWLVWGVDTPCGELCAMGWPPTIAKLADCDFVRKGAHPITSDERRSRIAQWGRRFDDDRAEDARLDVEFAL